jgi:protein-tyrosine phosphatase
MKAERLLQHRWLLAVSGWSARVRQNAPAAELSTPRAEVNSPAGRRRFPGKRQYKAFGMDLTWVTDRIAVGGGIWNAENMAAVARAGVTHIVDMQIEFDDTELAAAHDIEVLWNPIDDDFQPKPAEVFQRGVAFAEYALEREESKLLIHCAAGVHRAPMMALAVLGSQGWEMGEAMQLIESRRPAADFAEVYVSSVERFLEQRVEMEQ